MLKFLNSNQRNFIQKLSIILDKRRKVDDIKFKLVRQIIKDIKKNKDLSLIKYEKKYSKQKKIHSND